MRLRKPLTVSCKMTVREQGREAGRQAQEESKHWAADRPNYQLSVPFMHAVVVSKSYELTVLLKISQKNPKGLE